MHISARANGSSSRRAAMSTPSRCRFRGWQSHNDKLASPRRAPSGGFGTIAPASRQVAPARNPGSTSSSQRPDLQGDPSKDGAFEIDVSQAGRR